MAKSYKSLVWDIETGSVDDLWTYGPGYVRLVGYQGDDDDPVVTENVDELIQVILASERHYGFNSLSFDCIALHLWHGVSYEEITRNHVDLMVVERQLNPPQARGGYGKGYWGLDQTTKRYGHTGKSDNLAALAARFGGFDKIPVDNEEYVSYTYGDIEATRFLADRFGPEVDRDPYLLREMDVMRRIYAGSRIIGFKVDVEENLRRLEVQRVQREKNFAKLESKFGIPLKKREVTVFENPFRVDEGKAWFEMKCDDLGIGDLVPRTKKGDVSMAAKGIEKMLEATDSDDAVDFVSCVLGAIDGSDKDSLIYLNEQFGLPLQREVETISKKPLATSEGKARLEELFREYRVYHHAKKTGKTNQLSTNRDDLEWLVNECQMYLKNNDNPDLAWRFGEFEELAEVIIDVTTERSVFLTVENNRVGDVIHPQVFPDQATGRWGYTNPGITVMGKKGGKNWERDVFIAREGHVLVSMDLAQIDARIVAAESQDPNYMALFEPGKDLHSEVAMLLFGRCDGEWRDKAKAGSHGKNYSMGVNTMVSSLGMPREDAEKFDREWKEKFQLVEKWKQDMRDIAEHGYTIIGIRGRKMKPDAERAFTQGPGLKGQNGCREIIADGLLRMPWRIVEMLRGIIHDEYVFELPEDEADDLSKQILDCIRSEYKGVAIESDASPFGKKWGELY